MNKLINYSIASLFLSFILFSFVACKDSKDDLEPALSCDVSVSNIAEANAIFSESKWEWIESRTEGRNGEILTTPKTEGKTMSLHFNLGQSVEELENGKAKQIWEYRLNVSNDTTLGNFSSVWIGADGNIDRSYYVDVCPKILKLTDASTSLMTVTTYKRK